ncbi:MAG: hypothetical protein NTU79_15990 [Planctomycetota bacterium]|nr:hypothetical protein [Planctomycetota bacterium]
MKNITRRDTLRWIGAGVACSLANSKCEKGMADFGGVKPKIKIGQIGVGHAASSLIFGETVSRSVVRGNR